VREWIRQAEGPTSEESRAEHTMETDDAPATLLDRVEACLEVQTCWGAGSCCSISGALALLNGYNCFVTDQVDADAAFKLCIQLFNCMSAETQEESQTKEALFLTASQAAYLLALRLSQLGVHDKADLLLSCLGCRYKLSPAALRFPSACGRRDNRAGPPGQQQVATRSRAAWQAGQTDARRPTQQCAPEAAQPVAPEDTHTVVLVLDGAVPPWLLRSLQTGFKRDAAFWREHNYNDPSAPFNSYICSLVQTVFPHVHLSTFPAVLPLFIHLSIPPPPPRAGGCLDLFSTSSATDGLAKQFQLQVSQSTSLSSWQQ
jgi:hypothetical protein